MAIHSYTLTTLWHDRQRFLPGVLAVTFSAALINLQCGLLLGLFSTTSIPIDHSSADLWVGNPEVLRALYTEHRHGLPPGRTVALRPVLGASSVLLLEGQEHLARRRLMLPSFHGERMRSYETTVREIAEHEIARWPDDAQAPAAQGAPPPVGLRREVPRCVRGITR